MLGRTGLGRKSGRGRGTQLEGGKPLPALPTQPLSLSSCLRSVHFSGRVWRLPSLILQTTSDSSPPGSGQCRVSLGKSLRPGEPPAPGQAVSPRTAQGQGSSALWILGSLPSLRTGSDHTLQCRTGSPASLPCTHLCKPGVVVVLAGEHNVNEPLALGPSPGISPHPSSVFSLLSSYSRPSPTLLGFHFYPTLLPLMAREPMNRQVRPRGLLASSPTLAPSHALKKKSAHLGVQSPPDWAPFTCLTNWPVLSLLVAYSRCQPTAQFLPPASRPQDLCTAFLSSGGSLLLLHGCLPPFCVRCSFYTSVACLLLERHLLWW